MGLPHFGGAKIKMPFHKIIMPTLSLSLSLQLPRRNLQTKARYVFFCPLPVCEKLVLLVGGAALKNFIAVHLEGIFGSMVVAAPAREREMCLFASNLRTFIKESALLQ